MINSTGAIVIWHPKSGSLGTNMYSLAGLESAHIVYSSLL